jgi:hypothetical protein
MSGLDQRTKARREALAPAVNDSSLLPDAAAWGEIPAEWLQHKSSDAARAAVPAFPLALLPQPWRDWAGDAARSSAAPVDYVVQAMLAAAAGLGGRRVLVIPTPGWQEPLRLWLAAVGAHSTGKSPALAAVRRLLLSLEKELAATGDGGESRRQIVLGDGSFERIAAALARDPRGMVLWRDGPLGCLAPLGGRRSVEQLEPRALSIVGSIDPGSFGKAPGSRSEGLMARFLYAWPQALTFRPLAARTALPSSHVLAPLRRIGQACGALTGPHGLFLDEPAWQAFDAFRARLHEEASQAEGPEAAWLGKGCGAVACLAGTFTLMSWSAASADSLPRYVDLDSVERAIALWSGYYRPHARALLKRCHPTDQESQVRRVVRWLCSDGRPTLSREDVRRTALGETVNAGEADGVIARLVEADVLRALPRTSNPQGGRPALRWQVNPSLVRTTVAQTAQTART